jgi:hypothetical protein
MDPIRDIQGRQMPTGRLEESPEKKVSNKERGRTSRGVEEKKTEATDLQELLKNDPELQAVYDRVVEKFANEPPETVFSMVDVMRSLIKLTQSLQKAALAIADRLTKITEKLNAYATLQGQIPVILKGDIVFDKDEQKDLTRRGEVNQKFAMMLDMIRANKGKEEDKAKDAQQLLSTVKDAGTGISDYFTSFTDLIGRLGSKIFQ